MATITREHIVQWLERVAQVLEAQRDYLTQLDAAIGDADHGINMDRGFKKVMERLPGVREKDIGTILRTAGMALLASVGGAGGPLYGTLFMKAGMAVSGRDALSPQDLGRMLQAAVQGVMERGRAQPGDKTMVDALLPAVQAYHQALEEGASLCQALARAVQAAEEGMKATIPLVARKGRASYLGERSAGHQDPGATSSFFILQALFETLCAGTPR